jgi:hypothetical protein
MLTAMESKTLRERLIDKGLTLKERLEVYDDELYKKGMGLSGGRDGGLV